MVPPFNDVAFDNGRQRYGPFADPLRPATERFIQRGISAQPCELGVSRVGLMNDAIPSGIEKLREPQEIGYVLRVQSDYGIKAVQGGSAIRLHARVVHACPIEFGFGPGRVVLEGGCGSCDAQLGQEDRRVLHGDIEVAPACCRPPRLAGSRKRDGCRAIAARALIRQERQSAEADLDAAIEAVVEREQAREGLTDCRVYIHVVPLSQ